MVTYILAISASALVIILLAVYIDTANRTRQQDFLGALRGLMAAHAEQMDRLLSAQEANTRSLMATVDAMTETAREQATTVGTMFKAFGGDGTPGRSWVVSDQDEYNQYLNSLGYPTNGSPEEQLQWVLQREIEEP